MAYGTEGNQIRLGIVSSAVLNTACRRMPRLQPRTAAGLVPLMNRQLCAIQQPPGIYSPGSNRYPIQGSVTM